MRVFFFTNNKTSGDGIQMNPIAANDATPAVVNAAGPKTGADWV